MKVNDVIDVDPKFYVTANVTFARVEIETCRCYIGDSGYMCHTGPIDEEKDGRVVSNPCRELGSRMLNINRDIKEVATLLIGNKSGRISGDY